MPMEYAGDRNTNRTKRFRFKCPNHECQGFNYFYAVWEEAPEYVPSDMPCPFDGCDHEAKWCIAGVAAVHIAGKAGGTENPFYTTERAKFEHEWMANEIENTKKALDGEDQISGKASSPYEKYNPNMDALVEQGIAKPLDAETAVQKKRIQDERARKVAEQASDKLSDIDKKHVGRRHDG